MHGLMDLRDDEFEERVMQSRRPVVVEFWAPWCGPCRQLAPLVGQLIDEFGDRLRFLKVNTDENPKSPGEYRIDSIPTFLLFHDGVEKARWVGKKQAQSMRDDLIEFMVAVGI